MSEPSKVISVRDVSGDISANDLRLLVQPFGAVTKVVMLRENNEALLQMHNVASATTALQYFTNVKPNIRGINLWMQFSSQPDLTTMDQDSEGSKDQDSEPNQILSVTIHHMLYPITVEVLHQVFSPHGFVEKIATFQKSAGFQALIQYQSHHSAIQARNALQGRNIYDGSCQLDIQFSNLSELQLSDNNETSRDFTNPSLPMDKKGKPSIISRCGRGHMVSSNNQGSGPPPSTQPFNSEQAALQPSSQPAILPPPSSQTPTPASSSAPCPTKRGRGPAKATIARSLPPGKKLKVDIVKGGGVGKNGPKFNSFLGVVSRAHCVLWQKDFTKLPPETKEAIFREIQQCFEFEDSHQIRTEILQRMGTLHRKQRNKLKERHFVGKSFEQASANVPKGVDASQWQQMCEIWSTHKEQKVVDRNKANRSHLTMTYRAGRRSIHQMKEKIKKAEGRDATRPEIFMMSYCRTQTDGTQIWATDDCRKRMEQMAQLMTPSGDACNVTGAALLPDQAFVQVMGQDRPGRVRCAGFGETLKTWYGFSDGDGNNTNHQHCQSENAHLTVEIERLKGIIDQHALQLQLQAEQIQSQAHSQALMQVTLGQLQECMGVRQSSPMGSITSNDDEEDERYEVEEGDNDTYEEGDELEDCNDDK